MLLVLIMLVDRDRCVDAIQQNPRLAAAGLTTRQILGALWVISAMGIFWSLAAMALAVLAFRRVELGPDRRSWSPPLFAAGAGRRRGALRLAARGRRDRHRGAAAQHRPVVRRRVVAAPRTGRPAGAAARRPAAAAAAAASAAAAGKPPVW